MLDFAFLEFFYYLFRYVKNRLNLKIMNYSKSSDLLLIKYIEKVENVKFGLKV